MDIIISLVMSIIAYLLVGFIFIHDNMDSDLTAGFAMIASFITFFGGLIYFNI